MDSTEQKLYKSLGIEEFKKPYQRIIEEIAHLSAGEDAKVKIKKIREINPVLEFESSKFPEFRRILKKFKNNINKELTNVGEVWLFVHEDSSVKSESLVSGYVPATISPLPSDQFIYQSVFISKNVVPELTDHCNYVELKKVKVSAYTPKEFLIYIDEVVKKDIFDVLKFYKNFGDDRSRDYRSIIRELSDEREISDDLGASTLSASNGLSYSISSQHKHSIEPNIKSTYGNLQVLLPPLFQRKEFSLNFNSTLKILDGRKKLRVVCKPIPVYDYDDSHLYLKPYQKTHPNQTWAGLVTAPGLNRPVSALDLLQTVNYLTNIPFRKYEPFDISELKTSSAILDEEIWLWLIARRNFHINLGENSKKHFKKALSGTINELFGEILPDACIKSAAEYSLMNAGFKRSFETFCRFGKYENSNEDAGEFGNKYLKNIENFYPDKTGKPLMDIWKDAALKHKRRAYTRGKRSRIVYAVADMTAIAREIPYNTAVSSISSGYGYDENEVRNTVDWAIKNWGHEKFGHLKTAHGKNNEKIIKRVSPSDFRRILY